jgi:hypothetical protein
MIEKELPGIREIKNKEKKRKEKEKEYYLNDIDLTKMKIQRKKNIVEEGELVSFIKGLQSGRIAASIYDKFIAIIDPESLEIVYKIKEPCKNFLELEKDIIALVEEGEHGNRILLIKLEEKKYTVLTRSYDSYFDKLLLAKLWDGTLIVYDYRNEELCFFKNKNDLTVKDFSIKFKNGWPNAHFIFQTKKNEIVYDDSGMKGIIFYDFVEKKEKNIIKMEVFDFDSINNSSKVEMISDELLCIIHESQKNYQYCAYLINVYKYEKVNIIPLEESFSKFRALCSMKGKYLITITSAKEKIEKIRQFKVEEDNISLMHELEIPNKFFGMFFLNNGKNGKLITYDNYDIYEFY